MAPWLYTNPLCGRGFFFFPTCLRALPLTPYPLRLLRFPFVASWLRGFPYANGVVDFSPGLSEGAFSDVGLPWVGITFFQTTPTGLRIIALSQVKCHIYGKNKPTSFPLCALCASVVQPPRRPLPPTCPFSVIRNSQFVILFFPFVPTCLRAFFPLSHI